MILRIDYEAPKSVEIKKGEIKFLKFGEQMVLDKGNMEYLIKEWRKENK